MKPYSVPSLRGVERDDLIKQGERLLTLGNVKIFGRIAKNIGKLSLCNEFYVFCFERKFTVTLFTGDADPHVTATDGVCDPVGKGVFAVFQKVFDLKDRTNALA